MARPHLPAPAKGEIRDIRSLVKRVAKDYRLSSKDIADNAPNELLITEKSIAHYRSPRRNLTLAKASLLVECTVEAAMGVKRQGGTSPSFLSLWRVSWDLRRRLKMTQRMPAMAVFPSQSKVIADDLRTTLVKHRLVSKKNGPVLSDFLEWYFRRYETVFEKPTGKRILRLLKEESGPGFIEEFKGVSDELAVKRLLDLHRTKASLRSKRLERRREYVVLLGELAKFKGSSDYGKHKAQIDGMQRQINRSIKSIDQDERDATLDEKLGV